MPSRLKLTFRIVLFFLLYAALAGCNFPGIGNLPGSTDEPTGGSGDMVTGVAFVDEIQIAILESFPVQVQATVIGNLPDGCTTISDRSVSQDGNTFTVAIATVRPVDAICTLALVPFSETFSLDVEGLAAGKYTVAAGDVQANFDLAVDNVIQLEPTAVVQAETSFIQGVVWHDLCAIAGGEGGEPAVPSADCIDLPEGGHAADGIRQPGEPGLQGIEVTLGAGPCPATGLDSAFTDADGNFEFSAVSPGIHCVAVDELANPNSGILIPGSWTFPEDGIAQGTVEVSVEEQPSLEFGWDYQFLPEPEVGQEPGEGGENDDGGTVDKACTDKASFVSETIPDNTRIGAGQVFTKTWTLRNDGTCQWTKEYAFLVVEGESMGVAEPVKMPQKVNTGAQVTLAVALTAPDTAGTYRGDWSLRNEVGDNFGLGARADETFWVKITVEGSVVDLDFGDPDWKDTFENANNWFFLESDTHKFKVVDGQLEMRAITPGISEQWGLVDRSPVGDFYIEANFSTGNQCSGRDRFGLLVRSPEPNSGYVFNISCNGQFRVYRWDGANYFALQEWTVSPNIVLGPNAENKVGIQAEGQALTLYLNGVEVVSLRDTAYGEGVFGLLVGSASTANFKVYVDDISYWDLED